MEKNETKKFYNQKWFWVIIAIIIIITIVSSNTNEETIEETDAETIAEVIQATDISNFNYTIENDSITIEKYTGNDEYIIIPDTYNIDGIDYQVNNIALAIFNGCGNVTTIYLPKTIQCVYDYSLAYLNAEHIDLYFEGTEDEWNTIFTIYEPSTVSDEWNDGDYEGSGEALAYKLNSYIGGTDYDETKFTYYYNSTISNIEI